MNTFFLLLQHKAGLQSFHLHHNGSLIASLC